MGWQSHFTFRVEISGAVGPAQLWDKSLAVPTAVPLDQLFAKSFRPGERKALSLNHRKVLWAYENIPQQVWTQAVKELTQVIRRHPAQTLTIKASHAGVGVALAMLAARSLPTNKVVHFEFTRAPLAWLETLFACSCLTHSVKFTQDSSCVWSSVPGLVKPARQAA